MILKGALLLEPDAVRRADVRVEDGVVTEVGSIPGEGVDLSGKWLMPGMVCAHHHLYSALACGMPFLPEAPDSFTRMLELLWWRLDAALTLDDVEVSALVGGVGALRAGVTTVVDHHASPNAILGSLEALDRGLGAVGVRRVLCYEVTDRGGPERARDGLRAHEGLLGARTGERAVKVGMHASFTLSDATVRACVGVAREAGVGVHVHVAEAVDDDLARVAEAGAWVTHQPRSNMNNAVGYAPVGRFGPRTALGTDGIGADMLAELQAGYFRSQEGHAGWGPARWARALHAGAELAGDALGVRLGRVARGYAADLVVMDPCPGPPLVDLPAALVFRFSSAMVRDVMVGGVWRLRDRMPVGVDADEVDARARDAASGIWARMR